MFTLQSEGGVATTPATSGHWERRELHRAPPSSLGVCHRHLEGLPTTSYTSSLQPQDTLAGCELWQRPGPAPARHFARQGNAGLSLGAAEAGLLGLLGIEIYPPSSGTKGSLRDPGLTPFQMWCFQMRAALFICFPGV